MVALRWDKLLDFENKWVDEDLNYHFRLEFEDDEFDVDIGEFDKEMPIPEQSNRMNSYCVGSPASSEKTVSQNPNKSLKNEHSQTSSSGS